MTDFQYSLQAYKTPASRHICPACGQKKSFARYVSLRGDEIADHVGRCNRESSCSYHLTPKQFFAENPDQRKAYHPTFEAHQKAKPVLPPSLVSQSLVEASFNEKAYHSNQFVLFLLDTFGVSIAEDLVKKYCIGTSRHWPGATVFWQLDQEWKARTGKIMLYNRSTGKRVKQPYNHISWVHSALKLESFNLKQCLFGEHLLDIEPQDKPVAIVESEKTAVIASVYKPEFIWLACGGLSNLSAERFAALKGRKVVLFPDLNGYQKWTEKAQLLPGALVSDILENLATDQERQSGLDLADYLLRYRYLDFWTYPESWDDLTPLPGYESRKQAFEQQLQLLPQ